MITEKEYEKLSLESGYPVFYTGATCANMLGWSTQVPAKVCYITNGPQWTKKIGNNTIVIERAELPIIDFCEEFVNVTIQALNYMAKDFLKDNEYCKRMILSSFHSLEELETIFSYAVFHRIPQYIKKMIIWGLSEHY